MSVSDAERQKLAWYYWNDRNDLANSTPRDLFQAGWELKGRESDFEPDDGEGK